MRLELPGNVCVFSFVIGFTFITFVSCQQSFDPTQCGQWNIDTVAGGGTGDGFPALFANMITPVGVTLSLVNGSSVPTIYISDSGQGRVRRIDPHSGIISTIAGSGGSSLSFDRDGLPATQTSLLFPGGLVADASGTLLWFTELNGHRVRLLNLTSGLIYTVAGNGTAEMCGDGGPAVVACLNTPTGLSIQPGTGALAIADAANHRVRVIDSVGIIRTIVGTGSGAYGGDGGPGTAALLFWPINTCWDKAGNLLYIADSSNNRIRAWDSRQGIVTTIAGSGCAYQVIDGYVYGVSGDGGPATAACVSSPSGIALFDDVLVITAVLVIRSVHLASGIVTSVTNQTGGSSPWLDAVDGSIVFAASGSNSIMRLRLFSGNGPLLATIAGNPVSTPPGTGGVGGAATSVMLLSPSAVAFVNDSLVVSDNGLNTVVGVDIADGDVIGWGQSCAPNSPLQSGAAGVASDGIGGFFSSWNRYICHTDASGNVTLVNVAFDLLIGGVGFDATISRLLVFIASGTASSDMQIFITQGSNLAGRWVFGPLDYLAGNGAGAEGGSGVATAVGFGSYIHAMAMFGSPGGSPPRSLLFTTNAAVRSMVLPFGNASVNASAIETVLIYNSLVTLPSVAGGQGLFDSSPRGTTCDSMGNIYFSDYSQNAVLLAPRTVEGPGTGPIITIAGGAHVLVSAPPEFSGMLSFCGDGGPATSACLSNPLGLAISPNGSVLWVADNANKRIRKIWCAEMLASATPLPSAHPNASNASAMAESVVASPLHANFTPSALLSTSSAQGVTASVIVPSAVCSALTAFLILGFAWFSYNYKRASRRLEREFIGKAAEVIEVQDFMEHISPFLNTTGGEFGVFVGALRLPSQTHPSPSSALAVASPLIDEVISCLGMDKVSDANPQADAFLRAAHPETVAILVNILLTETAAVVASAEQAPGHKALRQQARIHGGTSGVVGSVSFSGGARKALALSRSQLQDSSFGRALSPSTRDPQRLLPLQQLVIARASARLARLARQSVQMSGTTTSAAAAIKELSTIMTAEPMQGASHHVPGSGEHDPPLLQEVLRAAIAAVAAVVPRIAARSLAGTAVEHDEIAGIVSCVAAAQAQLQRKGPYASRRHRPDPLLEAVRRDLSPRLVLAARQIALAEMHASLCSYCACCIHDQPRAAAAAAMTEGNFSTGRRYITNSASTTGPKAGPAIFTAGGTVGTPAYIRSALWARPGQVRPADGAAAFLRDNAVTAAAAALKDADAPSGAGGGVQLPLLQQLLAMAAARSGVVRGERDRAGGPSMFPLPPPPPPSLLPLPSMAAASRAEAGVPAPDDGETSRDGGAHRARYAALQFAALPVSPDGAIAHAGQRRIVVRRGTLLAAAPAMQGALSLPPPLPPHQAAYAAFTGRNSLRIAPVSRGLSLLRAGAARSSVTRAAAAAGLEAPMPSRSPRPPRQRVSLTQSGAASGELRPEITRAAGI